jgi:TonB family protein
MKDRKILIVDFDEDSLAALSNLVNEEGYQAVTASDGLSAYEKYKSDDFDLVLLEPMLPKLHGFELCKKITQDPFKKTPIIVVTGIYREPSCKMEALQVYGASAHFTKPWNKDDLRAKMLQLLARAKENEPPEEETREMPAPEAAPDKPEKEIVPAPKPAPREPKLGRDMDEIERELQAAVSSVVSPARKKEVKDKKDVKPGVDREIEAMLKGAIGELGLEEKKKKIEPPRPPLKVVPPVKLAPEVKRPPEVKLAPEPKRPPEPKPTPEVKPPPEVKPAPQAEPAKPEPFLKAAPPPPRPQPRPEKPVSEEKIPIAKEIRDRFPQQESPGNSIPRPAARPPLPRAGIPYGIDKTLIEIDKIPLETEKAPCETDRVPLEAEPVPFGRGKIFFDEYAEPRKSKSTFQVVGGLVAVILIATSATFFVLKSKKTNQPPKEMVSSIQPSLPAEFASRQDEFTDSGVAAREPETKPEPKKAAIKPAEQTPTDPVVQLAPALPTEMSSPQLSIQRPESGADQALQNPGPARQTETSPLENLVPSPAPKSKATEPLRTRANKGDLVSIDTVDIGPLLLRRVEPKYPTFALTMGLGGIVTVNALISEDGDVMRTEILKGIKGGGVLETAAEDAIKQWKFRPAQKDGVDVKVWKSFEVNFKANTPVKE